MEPPGKKRKTESNLFSEAYNVNVQDGGAITRSMNRRNVDTNNYDVPGPSLSLSSTVPEPSVYTSPFVDSSQPPISLYNNESLSTNSQPIRPTPPPARPHPSQNNGETLDTRHSSHPPPTSRTLDGGEPSSLTPQQVIEERPAATRPGPSPLFEEGEGYTIRNFETSKAKVFRSSLAKTFKAAATVHSMDYSIELDRFNQALVPFVDEQMRNGKRKGLRIHIGAQVKYDVIKSKKLVDDPNYFFNVKSRTILPGDNIGEELTPIFNGLEKQILDRKERGSGFRFSKINYFQITLLHYQPIPIGAFIPSPVWLQKKKATINVEPRKKDKDDECFLYAVLASLHPQPAKKGNRRYAYDAFRHELNTDNLQLPITNKKSIKQFERANPSLCINVYALDVTEGEEEKNTASSHSLYPVVISDNCGKGKRIVNLLVLENDETRHFISIKNLARLTRAWSSKSKSRSNTYVCFRCLQHCHEKLSTLHDDLCSGRLPCATTLPPEGRYMSFCHPERGTPKPTFICMDFETREKDVSSVPNKPASRIDPSENIPYPWIETEKERQHALSCRTCTLAKPCPAIRQSMQIKKSLEIFGYSYRIVDDTDTFPLKTYLGENPEEEFLMSLKKDLTMLGKRRRDITPMIPLTREEQMAYQEATACPLCERKYSETVPKVHDHHHR